MNSPRMEEIVDDLFAQALRSAAEVQPPADAWAKIAARAASSRAGHREEIQVAAHPIRPIERLQRTGVLAIIQRLFRRRRVASWMLGLSRHGSPSSGDLRCGGFRGACRPSPFADLLMTEILEFKLAS